MYQDLKVMYEDQDLVIVDKPSGVLCVPSEDGIPSLAQTVFEAVNHSLSSYDRMVVHRLGMDTSGLVLFAKTMDALRGLNTIFRTRRITREYEVLVCGHLTHTLEGTIDMPLMRDYVFPPYMRVSTEPHQRALLHLDAAIVGKKLLGAPKPCQTQFQVLKHEELKVPSSSSLDTVKSLPVTRLKLTSITGRTHQLNVHCAAFGHPIVGDRVYGFNGDAAPNGGLALSDFQGSTNDKEDSSSDAYPAGILVRSVDAASLELQQQIAEVAANMPMCVHARRLRFQHPVTNEEISISSPAVF
jgi:tRNA pseudouridine32 synthase / 23S rRNA pseudouridine746 synthase